MGMNCKTNSFGCFSFWEFVWIFSMFQYLFLIVLNYPCFFPQVPLCGKDNSKTNLAKMQEILAENSIVETE